MPERSVVAGAFTSCRRVVVSSCRRRRARRRRPWQRTAVEEIKGGAVYPGFIWRTLAWTAGGVHVSQLFTTRTTRVIPIVLILAAAAATGSAHSPASLSAVQCQPSGALMRIPDLPEASGLAVSRRTPGRLWSHNDSGEPVLVALDARGTVTARVRLTGVKIDDWEAIAVGACPGGSCVYVGDIGDNDGEAQAHHHLSRPRTGERGIGRRQRGVSCDLSRRRARCRNAARRAGRRPLHRDQG